MTLGQHCDEIIRLIDEALAGVGPARPVPATVLALGAVDERRREAADRRPSSRTRP